MNLPLTIELLKSEIKKIEDMFKLEWHDYYDTDSTYYLEQSDRLNQLKLELNIIECGHILEPSKLPDTMED